MPHVKEYCEELLKYLSEKRVTSSVGDLLVFLTIPPTKEDLEMFKLERENLWVILKEKVERRIGKSFEEKLDFEMN